MLSFNKAITSGISAGSFANLDLRPMGDYCAHGISGWFGTTSWGAFDPGMMSFVSGMVVAVVAGAAGFAFTFLVPNKPKEQE